VRHITHVEQPCHTYTYRTATPHTYTGVSRTLSMAGLAGLFPKTILQIVADRCRVLQCVEVFCSVLQCFADGLSCRSLSENDAAVCCSVLQRVAVCCRWPVLQGFFHKLTPNDRAFLRKTTCIHQPSYGPIRYATHKIESCHANK